MNEVSKITEYVESCAKAVVALFAAPLTYVANALVAGDPVEVAVLASYCLTAILVWAVPNKEF